MSQIEHDYRVISCGESPLLCTWDIKPYAVRLFHETSKHGNLPIGWALMGLDSAIWAVGYNLEGVEHLAGRSPTLEDAKDAILGALKGLGVLIEVQS
jgi:hypothetical protein